MSEAARILIVEDNHDSADSLATILRIWGYEVRVAYDGLEALSSVDSFFPDIVVTDLGLPGLDGFQLAQTLRLKSETRNVFLVAVSAYSDSASRSRSETAGIDEHLAKPVDLHALRNLLARRNQPSAN